MATRELVMTFEGASERVRPDRCAVRPLLEVLLAFVDLVEKIGAHEAPDADEAPFVVVMKELRKGSIKNVLGFVPRDGQQNELIAERAGQEAAQAVPSYLARRDAGPEAIRARAKHLRRALSRLPADVTAHLHGTVEAPLSELAAAPEAPTTHAVETFRARILRAGGLMPRVQLQRMGHTRPTTLEAPEELAKVAGAMLYAEADVTARVERGSDDRVLHGSITDLRVLESGDPVAAFDRWYEQAGKPWSKVKDIERGLGRGST